MPWARFETDFPGLKNHCKNLANKHVLFIVIRILKKIISRRILLESQTFVAMILQELDINEVDFFNIHGFEKQLLINWNQNGSSFNPATVTVKHSTIDGGWTWRNNDTCFQNFLKQNEENGLVSYVVKLGTADNCYYVIGFEPFSRNQ